MPVFRLFSGPRLIRANLIRQRLPGTPFAFGVHFERSLEAKAERRMTTRRTRMQGLIVAHAVCALATPNEPQTAQSRE
jgi:hypothetical protein